MKSNLLKNKKTGKKEKSQADMTPKKRINQIFNISTEARKKELLKMVNMVFLITLMSFIIYTGISMLPKEAPVTEEVNIETVTPIEPQEEIIEPVVIIEKAVISYEGLNIRTSPSVDGDVIGVYFYGDKVETKPTETESEWIETVDGNFIYREHLEDYDVTKVYELPQEYLDSLIPETVSVFENSRVSRGGFIESPASGSGTVYYNDTVNSTSGLGYNDIHNILSQRAPQLVGIADDVIEIESSNGINAIFTMAVSIYESGGGTSPLANSHNNVFGLRLPSGWISFGHIGESVYSFAKSISSIYFSQGLVTPWSINPVYCPDDGGYWANQVTTIMHELINIHNGGL